MSSATAEKGTLALSSLEKPRLIVQQPSKLRELTNLLETFENLNARVSERMGEDISGDMGGAGGATGSGQQGDDAVSPREKAIRTMPSEPEVLRTHLNGHIRQEVRKLDRRARKLARNVGHPGGACTLNELYAKIHRLNTLLAELIDATLEVLKRLFVRVFIDRQPVL